MAIRNSVQLTATVWKKMHTGKKKAMLGDTILSDIKTNFNGAVKRSF